MTAHNNPTDAHRKFCEYTWWEIYIYMSAHKGNISTHNNCLNTPKNHYERSQDCYDCSQKLLWALTRGVMSAHSNHYAYSQGSHYKCL